MTTKAATEAAGGESSGGGSPTRRRIAPAWKALVAVAIAVPGSYFLWSGMRVSPDVVWANGEGELRAGRFEQAEQAVRRLEWLRKPTPMDRMLRAQVALARGREDEGLAELSQVPDGHYMAAQARMMAGQVELRRHRAPLRRGAAARGAPARSEAGDGPSRVDLHPWISASAPALARSFAPSRS